MIFHREMLVQYNTKIFRKTMAKPKVIGINLGKCKDKELLEGVPQRKICRTKEIRMKIEQIDNK